jgi:hypothetical protein
LWRAGHTATLLPSGLGLVAGGENDNGANTLASAELYDPVSGTWTLTGSMPDSPACANAALLPDGTVLEAGGIDPN